MIPDIERMARKCGIWAETRDLGWLEHNVKLVTFAALIAEECAKACDALADQLKLPAAYGATSSAEAIRAKFALSNETRKAK